MTGHAPSRDPGRHHAAAGASAVAAPRGHGGDVARYRRPLSPPAASISWPCSPTGETVNAVLYEPPSGAVGVASLALLPTAGSPRSAGCIRRRNGSSGRSTTSMASPPTARPTTAPGSTTGPGRVAAIEARLPYPFLPGRGRGPAPDPGRARSMPGSSSPAISASPATARRWSGSRSGSAASTRGSRRYSRAPSSPAPPGSSGVSPATAR